MFIVGLLSAIVHALSLTCWAHFEFKIKEQESMKPTNPRFYLSVGSRSINFNIFIIYRWIRSGSSNFMIRLSLQ